MPTSRESGGRRDEGPAAGEQHGEQSSCAGLSTVESIPVFVSTFPFAGGRANGDLGRSHEVEGSLQPFHHSESDDQGVLEQLRRRVAFPHPDQAAA
jgi:hypothetical protein